MKIKYILGAMGMAFGMTGCNLDITMYDGVMEEQFWVRQSVGAFLQPLRSRRIC